MKKFILVYAALMFSVTLLLNITMFYAEIQWDCCKIVTISMILGLGYLSSALCLYSYYVEKELEEEEQHPLSIDYMDIYSYD